jgi:hypothetical protein
MKAVELLAEDATPEDRTRFLIASHGAKRPLIETLKKHSGEEAGDRRVGAAGPWAWNDNWEEEQ